MIDSITRSNGSTFFPKEEQLIIANSDTTKPNWYIYNIKDDGSLFNGKIFYSTIRIDKKQKGLLDGIKIDNKGNVFATGPGHVWVFGKSGKQLGKIKLA
jgi:gluconolactonase